MHLIACLSVIITAWYCGIPNTSTGNISQPRWIWATEWSRDGKFIAVGGDDSTVWIYNGQDKTLYKKFRVNSMVKGMSWHPKKNLLAIANMKGVQMLDLSSESLTTVEGLKTGGRGIGWNYSGELLALADGAGVIQIIDMKGRLVRAIPKHDNNSYLTVDWHPKKNIILAASDEIILFDTSGKRLNLIRHRKEIAGVLSVRWHPSGDFFASGDYGHEKEGIPTLLQFWKADGTKIFETAGHHQEIRNLRWSNNGKFIATASDALRIYSKDGVLLHTGNSKNNLWGIAWGTNDQEIVTGSFADGEVKLWNKEGKFIRDF